MSQTLGAALRGVEGIPIEVEVRISSQLPRVEIVGLPQATVRESTARVRSAIASAGYRFPDQRVTINLAPAELPKTGAGLDLAIAVGIGSTTRPARSQAWAASSARPPPPPATPTR